MVDCTLRKVAVHKISQVDYARGFTTVLLGASRSTNVTHVPAVAGYLYVIPSGPIPPNPTELLDSERMPALLPQLAGQYDYRRCRLRADGGGGGRDHSCLPGRGRTVGGAVARRGALARSW